MERARAVFFDAHGVLYDRVDAYPRLRALLRQWKIAERTDAELRPAVEAVVRRAMIGQASEREVFLAYLDAYGVTDATRRKEGCRAQAADHGDIRLIEGVIPTLRALRARGLRLGVITDTVAVTAEKLAWLRAAGLDLAWDAFANSREVGARKPDARIYLTALEQAGVHADEAVFVGHSARELIGAKAVGMATVAFQPDPGAVADMTIAHFADLLTLPMI
jgi:HAD superfamily hydrolase (TIGR01509 family)